MARSLERVEELTRNEELAALSKPPAFFLALAMYSDPGLVVGFAMLHPAYLLPACHSRAGGNPDVWWVSSA